MRHAIANAHIHSDSDGNGNCHIDSDSDRDGNAHAITDSNGDSDGDCDGAFANTDSNGDSDGNCYSDCNSDRIPAAFTDATATADTAAACEQLLCKF
jgi:hypothetical protein